MRKFNFEEVVKAVGGLVTDETNFKEEIEEVVIDSRSCRKGSLFVAIKGERVDGNDYVDSALALGASAVITTRPPLSSKEISVADPVKALGDLARYYNRQLDIPIFAVTGSSGKTTTKDMLYYALSNQMKVHRTDGNFNNEIGLPLTVLKASRFDRYMVLEMGMSDLGEIDYLCSVAKPKLAIITNIGTAHMEQLGSREAILQAKMEVSNHMGREDVLLLNADDDMLSKAVSQDLIYRVKTYGFSEAADYRCISYRQFIEHTEVEAKIGKELISYTLPTLGLHNISNSLAVLGALSEMGLDIQEGAKGLLNFKPSKLRMEISEYNGIRVINDSYNANPDSMKSVLSILKSDISGRRRVAVLGDMLELGERSEHYHREVGCYAKECCDLLVAFGKEGTFVIEGAKSEGMDSEKLFSSGEKDEIAQYLRKNLRTGDIVLLKGSRGMYMEELIRAVFGSEE